MNKIIRKIKMMFHKCVYDETKVFRKTRPYLPYMEFVKCKNKNCNGVRYFNQVY